MSCYFIKSPQKWFKMEPSEGCRGQVGGHDIRVDVGNVCVVYDGLLSRTVLGVVEIPTPEHRQVLVKVEAAILTGASSLDASRHAAARACETCGSRTRPVLQCGNMCGVIVGLGAAVDHRYFRINQVGVAAFASTAAHVCGRSGRLFLPTRHMLGNRPWPLTESPPSRAFLQRVVIEPFRFCGVCYFCERGQTNLCELGELKGCNAGLQQYVTIDCSMVHTIHEGVNRCLQCSCVGV